MRSFITFICCLLCSVAVRAQDSTMRINTTYLTGNVYVAVSYGEYKGTRYPANGLYVVTGKGIVLINTPWSEDQTTQLIDSLENRYHQKITHCIITHFHADCTAGLDILKAHGVKTYSTQQTLDLCKEKGEKQAQYVFRKDTTFNINGVAVQTYFPGEGHTRDNIVVWLPKSKVLYGGCFVKSTEAKNLGFVGDGNVKEWPASLKRLKAKFPKPAYLVPGHDGWQGGMQQVEYSLQLLK
jgi:metallo-beta-lactamase class B